jgi:hypothetical protein
MCCDEEAEMDLPFEERSAGEQQTLFLVSCFWKISVSI